MVQSFHCQKVSTHSRGSRPLCRPLLTHRLRSFTWELPVCTHLCVCALVWDWVSWRTWICEVNLQSECVQSGVSVLSVPEPQLCVEEGGLADRSCSCNWYCCFKMKEDFSSLENIMRLMELLSIILSKVVLTDRTGYLLLFNLSEARRSRPVHTALSQLHKHRT